MINQLLAELRSQHREDLTVYRRAHGEWRNRLVHYIMIPIEYLSFQLFLQLLAGQEISIAVSLLLSFAALLVALHLTTGFASSVFHLASCCAANFIAKTYSFEESMLTGAVLWTTAWFVQVGIGHYLFEKNEPNLANMSEVSYLSMCTSVLIAWSS
mmetsp:Transcript_27191/g.41138  ORF Transcript_27191/g.41138 Transcript_27191/m.41138 type:complete len:156 (-) Transcript_27191:282-749(-)